MNRLVQAALEHVRKHHPEVEYVVFTHTYWLYLDENGNSPAFGPEIDVAILEAAFGSTTGVSIHQYQS